MQMKNTENAWKEEVSVILGKRGEDIYQALVLEAVVDGPHEEPEGPDC